MKRSSTLREIRDSSSEELRGRLQRLEGELFRLRLKKATNQLEDIMQIRSTRREIARVLTVLAEKASSEAALRQGSGQAPQGSE